jgi:cell division protease FtsH
MLSIDTPKSPFLDPSLTDSSLRFGPDMAQRVSAAVSQLLNDAFALATDILTLNQSLLEETAQRLLAEETLDDQHLSGIKQKISLSTAIQQVAFSTFTSTENH